jgi:hypothetical protein
MWLPKQRTFQHSTLPSFTEQKSRGGIPKPQRKLSSSVVTEFPSGVQAFVYQSRESLEEIGLPRPMVASERSGGSPRCFKATKRATLESRSVRYGLCADELDARRTVCQMSGGDSLGIGCERSVNGMALVFELSKG